MNRPLVESYATSYYGPKVRPLGTKVLLIPVEHPEQSPGGILMPASYAAEEMEYWVVACGIKVPFDIQPRMRVICHLAGQTFEYGGHKFRLVDFKDVQMAVGVEA